MRRFTRVTNAFSNELANRGARMAVYFVRNNFARGASDAPRDATVEAAWRITSRAVGPVDTPEVVRARET